jgi:peroxiredoxin
MASRMSRRTRIIMVVVIIVVVALVVWAVSRSSCSSPESTLLSHEAPDFTLLTMTGANVTLSELEGTPVVLNFWATTCPACVVELPYFEVVAQESEGEIRVIAINIGQPISEIERFFGGYQPTMIVALDKSTEVYTNYSQEDNPGGYIPVTFFVDSEGVVKQIKIGAFQSQTELWDTLDSVS